MDMPSILFELNLDHVSGISEAFKNEYKLGFQPKFEQSFREAHRNINDFVREQVLRLCTDWQKDLLDLFGKHMNIQRNDAPDQGPNLPTSHHLSSEILGASVNCNVQGMMKTSSGLPGNNGVDAQKENIDNVPHIFSCDFNSDMEEGNIPQYRSPSRTPSNLSSPEKVLGSPILSKRSRKPNSKKSGSSLSNTSSTSVSSNNDSKISTNLAADFDKVSQEMKVDVHGGNCNQDEKDKQPLKTIENTASILSDGCDNKITGKVLGVLKMRSGKSELSDRGKRLRQTTLTLKKQPPVVDLGVMEVDETIDGQDSESLLTSGQPPQILVNGKDEMNQAREQIPSNFQNEIPETREECSGYSNSTKNYDSHTDDVEIIETSPQQGVQSRLRNKLSLNIKSGMGKLRIKSPHVINSETRYKTANSHSSKKTLKPPTHDNKYQDNLGRSHQQKCIAEPGKIQDIVELEKCKSFEPSKTLNDETFFSPAELARNRDEISECDIDLSEFEDNFKEVKTPPAKRILMDSFDIIPGRSEAVPTFAYKEGPVRKKNEKANLPGQGCRDCDRWWSDVPEEERTKRKNQCSKHRARFRTDVSTPESFWNPVIDYSFDSSVDDS